MRDLGSVFGLPGRTTDPPAVQDGDLWYRSDTDVIKTRCNGQTHGLAQGQVCVATTTTVALGTTDTDIPGLTVPVVAGYQYRWDFYVSLVNVGSPTNTFATLTGPTSSSASWRLTRASFAAVVHETWGISQLPHVASATAAGVQLVYGRGLFTSTSATNLKLQLRRVGGTSQTCQVGGMLTLERVNV